MLADHLIITLTAIAFAEWAMITWLLFRSNGRGSLAYGFSVHFAILCLAIGWLLATEYWPWLAERHIRALGFRGLLVLAGAELLWWIFWMRGKANARVH